MKSRFLSGAAVALGLAFSPMAFANVHLMKVVEVYPGSDLAPDAQYVMLQMFAGGQTVTTDTVIEVFDNTDTLIQEFKFPNNVASGTNQDHILIATASAQTLFSVTADLTMVNVIPTAGGKICFTDKDPGFSFGIIDCVAWGNFGIVDAKVGTPFNPAGLVLGKAIKRNTARAGGAELNGGDDIDDSAQDFLFADPLPFNNAGVAGASNTCNNGTIEGVEACDGANLNGEDCTTVIGDPNAAGLACNADCLGFNIAGCGNANVCGNGVLEAGNGEECDPPNVNGCDGACKLEVGGCGCNVASNTSPFNASLLFLLFAAPLFVWRRRSTKK
jgi:hypothetical protein